MSLNLALLLRESTKAHPEKTALAVGDSRLTYEALDLHARQVEFRDALPKGPTGKLLKREMRG
jgi:acyl-CoA synthetase (AMP-forming)/AMP-acid ligase II